MALIIDDVKGPLLFSHQSRVRPQARSLYDMDTFVEECESCGAAIGPCTDWPWHYEDEDCRAIRKPTSTEAR